MDVTSGTLAATTKAPLALTAFTTDWNAARKLASGVIVTPSIACPRRAAPRMSLFPVHSVSTVGFRESP